MPVVRVVADPPLDEGLIRRALEGVGCVLDVAIDGQGVAVMVDADPRTEPTVESQVRRLVVEAIQATRRAAVDPGYAEVLGRIARVEQLLAEVLDALQRKG